MDRLARSIKVPHVCPWCGESFLNYLSQRRRYCRPECHWAAKREHADRAFWAKVVHLPDGHNVFVGPCHPDGYGRTKHRGTTMFASRKAWILTHGELRTDQYVCHTCDFPPCCNIAHLRLASITDNLQERNDKGRQQVYPSGHQSLVAGSHWRQGAAQVRVRGFRYDPRRGVVVRYWLPSGQGAECPRDEFLTMFDATA